MDDKGRGYEAINIAPRTYLAGKVRFPKKSDLEAPSIAWYRNNLTTLSQYHNLFFIAFQDRIHVYQPQFPTQNIATTPQLEFRLPATRPGLRGYIDPQIPHAVNQLVLGNLGNEEILIATCDDGDVVAYSTQHIYNAIEISQNAKEPLVDPVRPFFKRNVGMSAWGIAIHKNARLIAISSNTKDITVFAFAIGRRSPLERSPPLSDKDVLGTFNIDEEDMDWRRVSVWTPDLRSFNLEIVLKGHSNHIPNIAFCNTEDDLDGHYLASTDINCSTYVWDIWQGALICQLAQRPRAGEPSDFGWRRGWGVACVDPRFCRLAKGTVETYGYDVVRYETRGNGIEADNSTSLQHIPDSSRWHPAYSRLTAVPGMLSELPDMDAESDEESDDYSDGEEDLDDEVEDLVLGYPTGVSPTSAPFPQPTQLYPANTVNSPHAPTGPLPTLPNPQHPITAQPQPLPFYLLTTTVTNLLLFHLTPSLPSATHSLTCKHPFKQDIPPSMHWLHRYERINMVLQVPELGLVVLGNQAGRVALLTMTVMEGRTRPGKGGGGFRIEWLLPLKSQEEKGMRPESPLLGIAVGPVQGREINGHESPRGDGAARAEKWRAVERSRRYRLLVTYYDHTILSYEIWRPANGVPGVEAQEEGVLTV